MFSVDVSPQAAEDLAEDPDVGIPESEPSMPRKKAFEERAWFNKFGGV